MGLMMLGAAMGDSITIHVAGEEPTRRSSKLVDAGRGAVRRRLDAPRRSPPFPTRRSSGSASLRDKKARRGGRAVPRRGAADPHRGARQRPPARDRRCSRPRARVHPLAAEIIAATEAAGGDAIETTPDILSQDVAARTIRRCCSAPIASLTPRLDARIDRAAAPLWIVAQALRDPGNIGTILRTGDAVGAGGLILIDDSADPFSVEAVRASMGAIFTQQVATARVGRIRRLAARRRRPAGRHQPQHATRTISKRTTSSPASC